jgi:hypothetical protein
VLIQQRGGKVNKATQSLIRFLSGLTFIAVVAFVTYGCDAQELERIRAEAENNARIAQACTPLPDERRVMEWAIINGDPSLTVTVQRFAGKKKDVMQYMILREDML